MNLEKEFEKEKIKHEQFFIPYYREKNWLVVKDNVGEGKISWDVKLEIEVGVYKLVDEKVRDGEFNDCLIELMQDLKIGNLGWYFGLKDWILYGSWKNFENKNPSSLYLISMNRLKNYLENKNGFINTCISKKGYGITWNIKLDWKELIENKIVERLI